jgi:hypothetical protein
MDIMYTFALEAPVDGSTHIGVISEQKESVAVYVNGVYGTVDGGDFVPSTLASRWTYTVSGYEFADLLEQADGRGRPAGREDYEFISSDVAAHFEGHTAVLARVATAQEAAEAA